MSDWIAVDQPLLDRPVDCALHGRREVTLHVGVPALAVHYARNVERLQLVEGNAGGSDLCNAHWVDSKNRRKSFRDLVERKGIGSFSISPGGALRKMAVSG